MTSTAATITRRIGNEIIPAVGFGTMGLGGRTYAPGQLVSSDYEPRLQVLDKVFEMGCTHWDTANVYGDAEELIGSWFKRTGKRNEIFLASKFGFTMQGGRGDPAYVKECIDQSLQKLGVDTIDLYYVHRIDKTVPIEITMKALVELVEAGKIRYIGLSQPSPTTLRRAHKVHPIAAIQVEYSPFELTVEQKGHLLETARELGVAVVAYAPLSRGLLTGQITSPDDFAEDDMRRTMPKYSAENFSKITTLVNKFKEIGEIHKVTSGQIALAFVLAQGDDIIPIPGSQRIKYIEENFSAQQVKLEPEEVDALRQLITETELTGDQYPAWAQAMLYADTPEI